MRSHPTKYDTSSGGLGTGPFVNANIEIKLDEMLNPTVTAALEATGSALKVSVAESTVLRVAEILTAHYGLSRTSTPTTEQVRIVLAGLGIVVRGDD